jgi:CRP-like cAMP-binding protein
VIQGAATARSRPLFFTIGNTLHPQPDGAILGHDLHPNPQVLLMSLDEEWGTVYDIENRESEDIVQVLSRAQLFADLSPRELLRLVPIMHHRDYFPRETIVAQNAPGAGLYIILSGSADVVLEDAKGEDIILASLGEGRMFGEISLVDGAPRTASVVSTTRSHVLGFFRADLLNLVDHAPNLGFKILYRLSQLLHEKLMESLSDFRKQEHRIRLSRRPRETNGEASNGAHQVSQVQHEQTAG